MRYDLRDIPDDLPPGRHPTRIGNIEHDPDGSIVVPVYYAPDKRIEDSAVPVIKHTGECRAQRPEAPLDDSLCRCRYARLPLEYPLRRAKRSEGGQRG